MDATTLQFAAAARDLATAARLRDLVVPGFRAPPKIPDAHRTIRRRGAVPSIAVRLRGRPWPAVLADMIEGVIAANDLTGLRADRVRAALWLAVDDPVEARAGQSTQAVGLPAYRQRKVAS